MDEIAAFAPLLMRRTAGLHLPYEDREDLVSETLLRGLRAAHTFDKSRHLEPWLWRILINLHTDNLRTKRCRPTQYIEDRRIARIETSSGHDIDMPFDSTDPSPTPEQALLAASISPELLQAIQSVPSPFRRTLIYCDIYGMSYTQIAAATHTCIGTIRSQIYRGRCHLRAAYKLTGIPDPRRAPSTLRRRPRKPRQPKKEENPT